VKVEKIMTRKIETIPRSLSLQEAAAKMRDLDVGVLPIVEDGKPVGIVSDRDMTIRGIAKSTDLSTMTVADVMTEEIHSVSPSDNVEEVAKRMREKNVRRVLVLDDGKVAGIVSLGDLALEAKDRKMCGEVLEEVSQPA